MQGWSLRVLADFLYSGRAFCSTDEIKYDLDVLLSRNIEVWYHFSFLSLCSPFSYIIQLMLFAFQVSCSRESVPDGVKIWPPEVNPVARDPGHANPATGQVTLIYLLEGQVVSRSKSPLQAQWSNMYWSLKGR